MLIPNVIPGKLIRIRNFPSHSDADLMEILEPQADIESQLQNVLWQGDLWCMSISTYDY